MNDNPPILIGEKVFWLGSGSGLPKKGKVKWIGKLQEIGPGWTIGVELDEPLPYGGIDGSWGSRKLFTCKQKHGLIVPLSSVVSERQKPPLSQLPTMNETSSAFARERANKHEKSRSDQLFLKDSAKDGKLKNSDNALVPLKPPQTRSNETQPGRNFETFRHEYLTQPRTVRNRSSVDAVHIQQEGVVYSWMVDHQVQNERLIFRRMGFRRRELNRSLDDGLASESPRNSFTSSRSSGSKKDRSSGIFSLFQWFKKQKSEDSSDLEVSSGLNSPELPRSTSITGSVDTLFSTATANSFAFVHPLQYQPFGSANQPEIRIAIGPETNTYKNRIRERERLKYSEKNISLREKYRLYASGTLPRSADHINELSDYHLLDVKKSFDHLPGSKYSTLGRKKRKAPPPPVSNSSNSENSLPAAVNQNFSEGILIKQHRRASSEPVKYIKLCHVKGKRRAPQPPLQDNSTDTDIVSLSTTNTNSSKRSKKKRRAPSPPIKKSETPDEHIVNIIREATDNILGDKNSDQQKEDSRDETISNASTLDIGSSDDVMCTDTLKLERGILKQNMEKPFSESRICPSSPVSPRPWYKRTTVNKEMGLAKEKEKRNERDRKKVEEWMLESGFPRRSLLNTDNKYNFFSKADKSDEKRKSQISILTNISELDREAAEIIRRGKEKEKSIMESQNAMYFNDNGIANENEVVNNISEKEEPPRKNSAKELISLFNAITNVTKVTVNSSFFSKDTSNLFNKERDKRSEVLNNSIIIEKEQTRSSSSSTRDIAGMNEVLVTKIVSKNEVSFLDQEKPGTSFSLSNSSSEGKIARVTIDEIDEFDAERNSKSQVLYEANRQNRHLSPPIPTITEVSESSAKSSPTSTIGSSNTSELAPDPSPEPVHMKHMQVWVCPRCTLENLRWRITCEACDMWRPNPFELRERSKQNKTQTNTSENKDNSETGIKTGPSSHLYPNITKFITVNKEENTSNASSLGLKNNSAINKNGIQDNKYTGITAKEKGFEQKSKQETEVGSGKVDKNPDIKTVKENEQEQQQAEEIRKARLAFFTKVNSEGKPNVETDIIIGKTTKTPIKKLDPSSIAKSDTVPTVKLESTSVVKTETSPPKKENITPIIKADTVTIKSDASSIVKPDITPMVKQETTPILKDMNKSTVVIKDDDEEKRKLKEMLIEMKHSLPKRPKPVKKNVETNIEATENKINKPNDFSSPMPAAKTSASASTYSNIIPNTIRSHESQAEAYLVESESVIEEIKIKKPSEKVSSSVQTSGLVKQICPKQNISSGKEILIPIKVEEHVIKDGILYTSISKDTRRIGTGTFELLRPRDFANIEAIKTESKMAPVHLYANIANDDDRVKNLKTEEAPLNSVAYIDKLSQQLTKPQGVAHFKARLDMSNDKNLNTLAINRLLKRLEVAIAGGNHELAATLARELAQLKVNCSVIRQKSETPGNEILVEMYVEDKVSHQGPFPMKISPSLTVSQLKDKIEREYEIPANVQRWILGKRLAANDEITLDNMGINKDGCPIFLYLVIPPEGAQSKATTNTGVLLTKLKLPKSNTTINIDISEKDLQEAGPSGINIKTNLEKEEIVPETAEDVLEIAEDVLAVNEPQTGANPIGTLALGWKCEICTLMNSPTRPGCAACTTERPKDYKVPEEYKLSEAEISRIDKEKVIEEKSTKAEEEEKAKNYQKLVDLEKDDLIIYPEAFECPVCLTDYSPMEGIVLRECLHVFCRTCISNTIQFSEEAEVKCPFRDNNYTCDSTLLQREIKALVPPEVYEEHLAKSIALAETKIGNAFHCKTPDCKGWCIYEDNVNTFHCPVCTHVNCLTCQAIHEGLNCKQFQEQLNSDSDMNIEAKRTKEMLQEMVDRGEAMNCPTCQVVLMKKWGCDWLRCSMCKTEICWVTRGPRWGPNGKGDTSGGCQCGVNGVKCHPKCTYCH